MNNKAGFMLMEILFALLIFCILAGIATGYITHACVHSRNAQRIFNAIQTAHAVIQKQDISSYSCHSSVTECRYTQEISSSLYKPLDGAAFRIAQLTISDACDSTLPTYFSTLVARL